MKTMIQTEVFCYSLEAKCDLHMKAEWRMQIHSHI